MYNVKRTFVNGEMQFDYNGLYITRSFWENAPLPICCRTITDEDMDRIIHTLYVILSSVYSAYEVKKYIEMGSDYSRFDKIDEYRTRVEESLFLEYGGKYYDGMTEDECESIVEVSNNEYIEKLTKTILSKIFTENEYMELVYGIIIDDVKTDIRECADKEFNDSDVSLAVQRTLMMALNIEI